uniref:Ribosomal protein S6 kinase n=1 Tax=Plectus sambesii TaxID=2011161 RepID=A0A914WQZ9_9BILA
MQKMKTLEHTIGERNVLEHIRKSPFLVNLNYAFQSESKLHLIMDYVNGGELFTHLCSRGHFDFESTRFYVAELVIALEALHKQKIVYRDLKLENVMLDGEGHVVLTDFGLSKEFTDPDVELHRANSYCGTIEYMAPEVVQRTAEGYTEVVDWWSLGVMAFELLTGCSPFTVEGAKNSSREIAERILSKKVPFPRNFNPVAKDFVSRLVEKDAKKRLGANGVQDIKAHKFFKGIDWGKMVKKELVPPIQPKMAHQLDVSNFAEEFTRQTPVYSPAESPDTSAKKLFRGYSYVSPSVMLSNNNVIGSEYLSELDATTNEIAALNMQKFGEDQHSAFFRKYFLDMTEEGYLGRGSFSVCRRCTRKDDNAEFAVKIVSVRFAGQANREAQILEICKDHRNIVKLIEVMSDKFHIYLVLELLKGPELLTRIRQAEKFTEAEAARIMRKLVSAVKFLHNKGAVHRDLKPENILFESHDPQADLRLVDFGFARLLPTAGNALNTPCFTLPYAAPEVLHRKGSVEWFRCDNDMLPQYNEQCDLWSLGVILFTMLSGNVPFHAKTKYESATDIMNRIRRAQFSFEEPEWADVSNEAKQLISGLLTVDPTKRFSVSQVAEHAWLQKGQTLETPLQTPTILNSTAGHTFNETLNAFLTANREGFHLMEVTAAPMLVRRRGKKRKSTESEDSDMLHPSPNKRESRSSLSDDSASSSGAHRKRKLFPVPEEASSADETPKVTRKVGAPQTLRPDSLDFGNPLMEYREPKPSTLRQTRETVAGASPRHNGDAVDADVEMGTETESEHQSRSTPGSTE